MNTKKSIEGHIIKGKGKRFFLQCLGGYDYNIYDIGEATPDWSSRFGRNEHEFWEENLKKYSLVGRGMLIKVATERIETYRGDWTDFNVGNETRAVGVRSIPLTIQKGEMLRAMAKSSPKYEFKIVTKEEYLKKYKI